MAGCHAPVARGPTCLPTRGGNRHRRTTGEPPTLTLPHKGGGESCLTEGDHAPCRLAQGTPHPDPPPPGGREILRPSPTTGTPHLDLPHQGRELRVISPDEHHGHHSHFPDLIADAQTTEEAFLRQIFVRDQMAEWSKQPLVMARADGVYLLGRPRQALSRRASRASTSSRSGTTTAG